MHGIITQIVHADGAVMATLEKGVPTEGVVPGLRYLQKQSGGITIIIAHLQHVQNVTLRYSLFVTMVDRFG